MLHIENNIPNGSRIGDAKSRSRHASGFLRGVLIAVLLACVAAAAVVRWWVPKWVGEPGGISAQRRSIRPFYRTVPATEPEGTVALADCSPVKCDSSHHGGLLYRELIRQAFLIAARDELGRPTRDAVLGEVAIRRSGDPTADPAGHPIFDIRTTTAPGAFMSIEIFRGPQPSLIWERKIDLKPQSPAAYLAVAEHAAAYSAKEFADILREQLGKGGTKRGAMPAGAPDDRTEELLADMCFIPQYAALRRTYAAIEAGGTGASTFQVGALVRAYANLGILTGFHWTYASTVYSSRSIVYAERLVLNDGRSALALAHRAYARALGGFDAYALEDIKEAKSGAEASGKQLPEWVQVVEDYCHRDTDALRKSARAGRVAELGAVLAMRAVEYSGSPSLVIDIASRGITTSRDSLCLYDALSDVGDVSVLHNSTLGALRATIGALNAHVPSMEGMPASVKAVFDQPGGEGSLIPCRDVARKLYESGLSDAGEPSWLQLGRMLQESYFVAVNRRANFMAYQWSVSAKDFIETAWPLVEDHRYAGLIRTYGLNYATQKKQYQDLVKDISIEDANMNMQDLFRATSFSHAPRKIQGGSAQRIAFDRSDDTTRDLSRIMDLVRLDEKPSKARKLLEICPYSAKAAATLVEVDWASAEPSVESWKRIFTGHPIFWFGLGRRYDGLDRKQDAVECYRRALELSPDPATFRQLAALYKYLGDDRGWKATMDEAIRSVQGLRQASLEEEVARRLMNQGKWKEALPYAEASASSWSAWGMGAAAECCEGLNDFASAETWRHRISERYESEGDGYYRWCRRTAYGNEREAAALARAYYSGVGQKSLGNMRCFHMLEGETEKAYTAFKNLVETNDPYNSLHLSLLADEMKDITTRDNALRCAVEKGAEYKIGIWHRDELIELAKMFQKAIAAGPDKGLDFDALDRLLEKTLPDERTNMFYFAGRFLDLRGMSEKACEYYAHGATSPRTFKNNCILCLYRLREKGLDAAAIARFDGGYWESRRKTLPSRTGPTIKLMNDDEYERQLQAVLAERPAPFAPMSELCWYEIRLASAYAKLRMYEEASNCAKECVMREQIDLAVAYANASVYLGKLGRYAEAIDAAQVAVDSRPANQMHGKLLLVEWLYRSGRQDEARRILGSVKPPSNVEEAELYYGSLACVAAAMGDEEAVKQNARKAISYDLGGHFKKHGQRDIVFDAYRSRDWFIELFGKTLIE